MQITHRALLNHNFAIADAYELGPQDRVLQFSPFSFDVSVEELFPSWLRGCAVVMRSENDVSSPSRFMGFLRREALSVINIPTAYWHELVEHAMDEPLPPSVRLVIIGGEKASRDAWRRWKQRAGSAVKLINAYGPTEATITATLHAAGKDEEALLIGRPIANVCAVILDDNLAPVPVGAEGELHLAGAGLARGYLNRPELSLRKFIPNPFPEFPSERLYKTGDLARFRPDGTLEFLGRRDGQVKIRGHRIELGEVETALSSHFAIWRAAAAVREDAAGKERLVGYFVPRKGSSPRISELREFLKTKLPEYMLPSSLIRMESLPMAPSGKVDREALPKPGDSRPELEQPFVAPRTPVEEVIAGIWGEVLGLNRIGVHDNFFDLGGHSLVATQVISRMRQALQVEIPLASLFSLPTISALAERLAEASPETQPVLPVSAVSKGIALPMTPAQSRLWFLDQFEPQQSSYNIPTAFRLKGPLNVAAFEKSLTELARRHDALRAVFPAEDGQPKQILCEPKQIRLTRVDLCEFPESERESRAQSIAVQAGRQSYVMSSPMLRPILLRLSEKEHLCLLITHALACDSVSVRRLHDELLELYEAFATGKVAEGPAPRFKLCRRSRLLAFDQRWAIRATRLLERSACQRANPA